MGWLCDRSRRVVDHHDPFGCPQCRLELISQSCSAGHRLRWSLIYLSGGQSRTWDVWEELRTSGQGVNGLGQTSYYRAATTVFFCGCDCWLLGSAWKRWGPVPGTWHRPHEAHSGFWGEATAGINYMPDSFGIVSFFILRSRPLVPRSILRMWVACAKRASSASSRDLDITCVISNVPC